MTMVSMPKHCAETDNATTSAHVQKGTDPNRITLFGITILESPWLYKQ